MLSCGVVQSVWTWLVDSIFGSRPLVGDEEIFSTSVSGCCLGGMEWRMEGRVINFEGV